MPNKEVPDVFLLLSTNLDETLDEWDEYHQHEVCKASIF
jgi:hypothetical protein